MTHPGIPVVTVVGEPGGMPVCCRCWLTGSMVGLMGIREFGDKAPGNLGRICCCSG
jgi:hypothetical protein